MRLIHPKTEEYNDCLKSLLKMRFIDTLKLIRSHHDAPIQILNEGDDEKIDHHPLNFALFNYGDGFALFPI